MTACQFCKQEITWARTTAGNMMPIDPQASARGTIILIGMPPVATVLTKHELEVMRARQDPPARLYTSHWDSCPYRERARQSTSQMTLEFDA